MKGSIGINCSVDDKSLEQQPITTHATWVMFSTYVEKSCPLSTPKRRNHQQFCVCVCEDGREDVEKGKKKKMIESERATKKRGEEVEKWMKGEGE